MGKPFEILIMATSYSHDIATALLAASAWGSWILSRLSKDLDSRQMETAFVQSYRAVTFIAKVSLYWILLAGVPRIIFYNEFEWLDSLGNHQVFAIIVKHILMFYLVVTGVWHWRRLGKKARLIAEKASA